MKAAPHDRDSLRELLTDIEYATLTTRTRDGGLASRPLQTMQVDDAGAIWFFTSSSSGKIDDIRFDEHVSLVYADPARKIFVSLTGRAEVIVDRAKVDELWKLGQTIFFPQGRDDPSLVLLKITPLTARYWDGNESPFGLLLKFGKAVLRHEASDLGESRDIDLGAGS
jgi:general stress protein 26